MRVYFHGLMSRPDLGWSLRVSSLPQNARTLRSFASHDRFKQGSRPAARVPRLAVEYVMFHEMLHLRHPVEHKGSTQVRAYSGI